MAGSIPRCLTRVERFFRVFGFCYGDCVVVFVVILVRIAFIRTLSTTSIGGFVAVSITAIKALGGFLKRSMEHFSVADSVLSTVDFSGDVVHHSHISTIKLVKSYTAVGNTKPY